tara:strand:+ start:75 stop:707 length:633 start_codon:yes stop_codon:yes gene_type:complete
MSQIFEYLIRPYQDLDILELILEILAVILGLISVWFAKKDKILVYPTGMISTAIFVYLLIKAGLLGDMLINAYFFMVSIYGWYFWRQKKGGQILNPILKINRREIKLGILLFTFSIIFVFLIYYLFGKWIDWTAPIDTFTTSVFFVAMWLMARRKLEHWILWIVGDLISIPLYLYKGLAITSIQYLIFTLIAIFGYIQWLKTFYKKKQIV